MTTAAQSITQSQLQQKANLEKELLRPGEHQVLYYLRKLGVPFTLKAIRFREDVREIIDIWLPNRKMALMVDRQWSYERLQDFRRTYPKQSIKFISSAKLKTRDEAYKHIKAAINTPNKFNLPKT